MSETKNETDLLKKNFSQEHFISLYENAPLPFISWNNKGKITNLNKSALELFSWKKEEIIEKDFISTIIAEQDRSFWRRWDIENLNEMPNGFISRAQKYNSEIISCSWNNIILQDETGFKGVISTAKDISGNINTEIEMDKLVKAINETDNWVVITDPNGNIEYANTTVKEITGYDKEEIIGRNPSVFKSGKHKRKYYDKLWETIESGEVFNDVMINQKKSGDYFYSEQTITPIKDYKNDIINYISVGKDITQNEKLRRKIEYLSNYDISIGLPNRKAITNKTDKLIEIDPEQNLAALVININRIKYLNDIYNDPNSETSFFTIVSDLINKELFKNNTGIRIDNDYYIAYLGGDNFAIIIDELDEINEIYKVAEKILNLFTDTIVYNHKSFMLKAKIGISIYPDDCMNAQNLLSNAEIALINIEEDNYAFFDFKMNKKIKAYTEMETKLDKAVKNDKFTVFYQPYFRGENNELYAFEALLRLQDGEKGIISPAEFISVLENSSLIKRVGLIVINKVVNTFKKWESLGFELVPISINLSAKQLADSDHLRKMFSVITKSGIDNSLFKFEITESSAMDDVDYSLEIMNQMKEKGFSIAIDDFGTGYSSFSYLQKFPIDYLKIDISFIQNMTLNEDGKNIVESIINIAHLLNLKTIAEGVEKKLELDELNKLNNDYIQGYYYSRPLPQIEATEILKKNNN